ncbi:MAG: 4,5-DOPA dioxygenase extradiol [Candidatus Thorarchaeota archaeon]
MSDRMPTLFVGHGSPMNAVEDNEFTRGWEKIAKSIPEPKAILCISAHWFVPSTSITSNEQPKTIHDFYGFPPELYRQQYSAPGNPVLATKISEILKDYSINLDTTWGLDHGTWSVLKKMYPKADIPTIQLSINYTKPPQFHFELGHRLELLRNMGVLIIGSGNLVHNLGAVAWNSPSLVYEWAQQFEDAIIDSLYKEDPNVFIGFENIQEIAKKSHPSPDHYLPLLYAVGAGGFEDEPILNNQKLIHGSISMTCFTFR